MGACHALGCLMMLRDTTATVGRMRRGSGAANDVGKRWHSFCLNDSCTSPLPITDQGPSAAVVRRADIVIAGPVADRDGAATDQTGATVIDVRHQPPGNAPERGKQSPSGG